MKSLFAFWVPVILTAGFTLPATAQFGAKNGALGGSFASRGSSRPLGGIAPPLFGKPGFPSGINRNNNGRGFDNRGGFDRGRRGVLPFAYSTYIPNYFDDGSYYDQSGYPPAPEAAPPAPVPQQQPVIINQYFSNGQPSQQANEPAPGNNNAQAPGDPLGDTENYYLIAYKNHAVYAVLAYWVEDKTLHYVTTQNTHNQASLDLIDLDLTKSLNQARNVPFSIAGK